jgi:hypothetical protein
MNAMSLMTSVAAMPPGVNRRSHRATSASRAVLAKASPPSDSTVPPRADATTVKTLGKRLKMVWGAVKSSWVMPG